MWKMDRREADLRENPINFLFFAKTIRLKRLAQNVLKTKSEMCQLKLIMLVLI